MDTHATHAARRRIRWWHLAVGAVAMFAGAAGVNAAGDGGPASAGSPAERLLPPDSGGLLFPIEPAPMCEFLNNFGESRGRRRHEGVDIGAQGPIDESGYPGQEVYAVEAATVYEVKLVDEGTDGIAVRLQALDRDVRYRYFHLASVAPGVEVGATVGRGDLLGHVGDTGNATPGGWHLHFEVRPGPDYEAVDPAPLLTIPEACRVYGTVAPLSSGTTAAATGA